MDDAGKTLLVISIHTLRVEGDRLRAHEKNLCHRISIHTLRVEGDRQYIEQLKRNKNFNPHPPGGG